MMARPKRPTAVFASNDHMAIGALEAFREAGLKVPGDMAMVGFDDIEMSGLPGVDLTTITQKKDTMGPLAVDVLLDKINMDKKAPPIRITLEPILVIRKTCGSKIAAVQGSVSPMALAEYKKDDRCSSTTTWGGKYMDLITGGTGFIGSCLAKTLLEQGRDVATLDIKATSPMLQPFEGKWRHFQGNLGNLGEVLTAVSEARARNHLSSGRHAFHALGTKPPGLLPDQHGRDLQLA